MSLRAIRAGLVGVAVLAAAVLVGFDVEHPYDFWLQLLVGAVPIVLGAWYILARAADERLVVALSGLSTGGPDDTVREALRRALGDPDLDIVYAKVGSGGWISGLGDEAGRPAADGARVFTPIDRGGKPVAGLVHDRSLLRNPRRLKAAIEAASLALDNERVKAQLRAELLDVQASRARIIDAADRELQRVERNLHDGAQQRLVGLALMFRQAARRAAGDPELADLLADAAQELRDATAELRELTRGLHPAIVDDAGLHGALESLAERPGVPVDLVVDVPERLAEVVEVAAYYLVSEALTNVNKHSGATVVTVRAQTNEGFLRVTVSDDGAGGATIAGGSGLEGMIDRISTLAGSVEIHSPVGAGTTVSADIPLHQVVLNDAEQRRMVALRWFINELWEMPGEAADQITDEDTLLAGKAILLIAGGNKQITDRERDWLAGYLTAARDSDWVIDAVAAYDDSDTLTAFMELPGFPPVKRGHLYEAIWMCSSDGPLTPEEYAQLERSATELGIDRSALDELCAVAAAEAELRRRRFVAAASPALPTGL